MYMLLPPPLLKQFNANGHNSLQMFAFAFMFVFACAFAFVFVFAFALIRGAANVTRFPDGGVSLGAI